MFFFHSAFPCGFRYAKRTQPVKGGEKHAGKLKTKTTRRFFILLRSEPFDGTCRVSNTKPTARRISEYQSNFRRFVHRFVRLKGTLTNAGRRRFVALVKLLGGYKDQRVGTE